MPDSTQGQGSLNPQGTDDAPKAVTLEDVTAIVNKAISSRNTAFEKRVADMLGTALSPISTKLEELGTVRPQGQPEPKPGDQVAKIEDSPQFKGMQKQLADALETIKTVKGDADREKATTKDMKLRQTVTDALTKIGIDPARVKIALGHLVDAEKRVRFGDDDAIVMKADDGQEVDLDTAIKSWAKTDDAKVFMPPQGIRGSGNLGGKKPNAPQSNAPLGPRLAAAIFGDEG